MAKTIRPIHARKGEIVRIIWHHEKLAQLTELHTAPPDEVWRNRLACKTEMQDLEKAIEESDK